jgi:hypothetical protein
MRSPIFRRLILGAAAAGLTACGDTSRAGQFVQTDTLPGGIPRIITSHPVDSGRYQLVRARDIQPPELDSAELLNPRDLAIADDGSVLVVDSRPTQVKVYGPDGRLRRIIGREGSGPGEFLSGYAAVRGDTLVVQDPQNARATTFDWRTGAVLSERHTACCYFSPITIDDAGRAVVRSMSQPSDSTWRNALGFVRFPLTARTADTIFVLGRQDTGPTPSWIVREGNRMMMSVAVPLQPYAHTAVDPTGGFVTGWSGDYLLRATHDGRDTVMLFGRRWTPEPVTGTDRQTIVDHRIAEMTADGNGPSEATLRASFDVSMIPDKRPAYDGIAVDAAGRRWVRRTAADTATVQFDLFDHDGRWLDVVAVAAGGWPRSTWASVAWGRDAVAVVLEDAAGRPLVRVYRIRHR